LVVIPAEVRAALIEHSQREAPNEACGLVLLRDGRAERYEPGRNAAASPYRFELEFDDPDIWYAEDDGYELAVFHSHISAPARPSRTDVENIGLWEGKPYLVYSLQKDDLAAFRIDGGQIERLAVVTSSP
jgi:[CysO sulfur-carrier protein]-S-L-cysteine hydrolase